MPPPDAATWIESKFSRLGSGSPYAPKSDVDQDYNCIAFAAGDTTKWWWPPVTVPGGTFWPPTAPPEETLSAFVTAFQSLGYDACDNGELESGFEKVAIYEKDGVPSHAARQQDDGTWVSKLGSAWDIEHGEVEGVGGDPGYGNVAAYLRRPR